MMTVGLLVGILAMLFFTPYVLCKGIHIISYDEITFNEKLKCMIPIYNKFTYERLYTGGLPWIFIFNMIGLVSFIVRLIEVLAGLTGVIGWITIFILVIGMFGSYVCNAIFVFRILKDADCTSIGVVIVFAIIYPLGQYYIGTILPRVLHNLMKEESTFLDV